MASQYLPGSIKIGETLVNQLWKNKRDKFDSRKDTVDVYNTASALDAS